MKQKQKKGAMQMTLGTMVGLVIALVVLTMLILAFTKTGQGFMDTISGYFSKTNIDDVVNECNRESDLGNSYSFCCVNKKIKLERGKELDMSCFNARNESWGVRISEMNCRGIC